MIKVLASIFGSDISEAAGSSFRTVYLNITPTQKMA